MFTVIETDNALKSTVFCDVILYSQAKVHGPFGGMYCLRLRGWRISQEKNQQEAYKKQSACCPSCYFFLDLLFDYEDGGSMVPPESK